MKRRYNTNILRGIEENLGRTAATPLAECHAISRMLFLTGSARGLVPPTVFKTAVSGREARGVGSIPMRFRQPSLLVGFGW